MRQTEVASGVEQPPDGSGDAAIRREMKRGEGGSNPLSTVAAATAERHLLWSPSTAPSSTATTQRRLEVRTRQHPKIARYPPLTFSISGHGRCHRWSWLIGTTRESGGGGWTMEEGGGGWCLEVGLGLGLRG
ncbi:unnamed protein product [Lactuca virosa]|uniref:FBA domain-containing protein n=1 Tax=Lactuca virosa TaxID=75947 RepID=A0AAU9NTI9_9ASTR|nr:unnamed protein product [Lactuca virosa]